MSSSSGQPPTLLLHGDLELTIHEARGLPNMDVLSTLLRRLCFCPGMATTASGRATRSVSRHGDDNHHHHPRHRHRHKPQPHGKHILPTSDPYAAVVVPPDTTVARTHVVRNSEAPDWSTTVVASLAHATSHLLFQVRDADPFGSDLIGVAALPAADILSAADTPIRSRWLALYRPDGRGTPKPDSAIRVSATFVPAARSTAGWRDGGGGVPAYFPLRRGCEVKLYQDAHVAPGELCFHPAAGRCWEDLCLAVLSAQHLVYVAGWAVHPEVRLLREAMSPEMAEKAAEVKAMAGVAVEDMNLGQLLKYKSQEGVRVCLLVWDDDSGTLSSRTRTGTHAEETKRFFNHSSVICVLSKRHPSSKLGIGKQRYTHHQKCVLVDSPASETTRRITAFLGGLDLCSGRYDTPSHRLFRDLDTVFRGDVFNPTSVARDVDAGRGPRQPWHDMHCRLDGPAAYDVLTNFEQRWRKATKLRAMFGKKSPRYWKDDALLKLQRIPWIHSLPAGKDEDDGGGLVRVLPEDDPECWQAQVFRSIDSGSVKGFPRPWETDEMLQRRLLCDKNVSVEQSIHAAYVSAIRSAERFLYIENQCFIGSSYAWPPPYRNPGAGNLVPMEVALKVAAKIRAGEPFAAYVVIPMWPEGNPGSGPAQEILFWQRQTMEMMYGVIARELESVGLQDSAHPQDYLNFYCLGTREEEDHQDHESSPRRWRRFMVYVHSKGMIVDDEYVIVGSANINQRSLAGSRDTEIAVGAYQPHHASRRRGSVYAYRMSLWEEHLGREVVRRPEADRPESPECVRMVSRVARENWARYTADAGGQAPAAMQGHLMMYPVHVGADGKVGTLPGHETFPDVGGRILGSTNNQPDYLTM